jgi:hypothetical protein
MEMLTNAARKAEEPCAPRSLWQRCAAAVLASVAVGVMGMSIGCGADGATLPDDASYAAVLTGANEIPPRSTAGGGSATFEVRDGMATYRVTVSNLDAPVTLAHLLIGSKEQIGLPIVRFPLSAATGTIATGTIDLRGSITFNNTTISGDSLRALFENGNAYVNVYTSRYPSGEVRGQVGRVAK